MLAHRTHDLLSEHFSEKGHESDATTSNLSQLEYDPSIEPVATR